MRLIPSLEARLATATACLSPITEIGGLVELWGPLGWSEGEVGRPIDANARDPQRMRQCCLESILEPELVGGKCTETPVTRRRSSAARWPPACCWSNPPDSLHEGLRLTLLTATKFVVADLRASTRLPVRACALGVGKVNRGFRVTAESARRVLTRLQRQRNQRSNGVRAERLGSFCPPSETTARGR